MAADNTLTFDEGAVLRLTNFLTLSDDPFSFSGFELTINGPFPSNGNTPLLVEGLGVNVNNNNTSSDPGPYVSIVPEPSSLALLGLGGLLVVRRRRVAL
jgi:hypothetical protein